MPLTIDERLEVPDAELVMRFTPSGGPGGQHANKANTRVELQWNIVRSAVLSDWQRQRLTARFGEVVGVTVDDERSQMRNRDIAERRLAQRIREALVVPKKRRKTKPSRGAKERRLRDKRSASRNKQLRRRPGRED